MNVVFHSSMYILYTFESIFFFCGLILAFSGVRLPNEIVMFINKKKRRRGFDVIAEGKKKALRNDLVTQKYVGRIEFWT